MQQVKLTPLEILQKQKVDLRTKSDELAIAIEGRTKYLQQNFVPLLRDNAIESVVSKLPPYLRNLSGSFLQKEKKTDTKDSHALEVALGIAVGIAEIVPFFLKGKKGAFLSILLKQGMKWIAK